MAVDQSEAGAFGGRTVSDEDILNLTSNGAAYIAPKTPHTMLIILGAVAILWILGAVTFKGIRQ